MVNLAQSSIRHPRAALLAWTAVAVVLSLIGLGVSKSLSPSIVVVPGTESARAQALADASFGPTQLVPILLQGPRDALERQGPRLVAALVRRPRTRALSAWDSGAAAQGLRPSADAAMIVVSVDRPEKDVVDYDQPQIERLVARTISAPVRASVTGEPSIDRALKDSVLSATRRAELIAIAILFVLLLLALRAPFAAAAVTLVGVATVLSTYGLMALLGKVIETDPTAVALASITGLALGVGYSLLIIDRFHQLEGGHGGDPRRAARDATEAVASTGRAVLIAGGGLVLALLLATAIAPTKILASVGVGVLLCSAGAVAGAVVVLPAVLVLFPKQLAGPRAPAPGVLTRDWDRLVAAGAWVRHSAIGAGAVATAALLVLAIPVVALSTGPPGVAQLPKNSPARRSFEEVARVMGPGWPTPYNVIFVNPRGPITTASTLAALEQFQARVARDPRVASVAGPGSLSAETRPLETFPGQLQESAKLLKGGKGDLQRLVNGLGRAGSGATQLHGGLIEATSGAGQLHTGSHAAQKGAGELHAGLAAANSGSGQVSKGLSEALAGAQALKSGSTEALAGSVELANGIGSAATPVASEQAALKELAALTASTGSAIEALRPQAASTSAEISAAISDLQPLSADPAAVPALAALERARASAGAVATGLESAAPGAARAASLAAAAATKGSFLAKGLEELHAGAIKLQAGLAKLNTGNAALAAGIGKLARGGSELTAGLTTLRDGAGRLETGLGRLTSGTGQLESGLAGAVSPTGQLVNGLGVMQRSVAKFRSQLPSPKGIEELRQQSPGLFNSGYFLLAAISGAPPASSNAAGFAVNLARGGTAGQVVVVSRYSSSAERTATLGDRLTRLTKAFAVRNRLQAAVGGPAGNLTDFESATNARLPWVIVALALAIALMLAIALRAVAIAVVAVVFDLLTAAATFGAMSLLFGGSSPPLGGPGYLDPMTIVGIFASIFGISLVFTVVLLARAREELVAGADPDRALGIALRSTAAASTGAALLMAAAAVPFATTELLIVREFGIGVAIAVMLGAFVVRPVLLPAAIALLGERAWLPTRRGASKLRIGEPQTVPMSPLRPTSSVDQRPSPQTAPEGTTVQDHSKERIQ